jgi:hypothetical protein
VLDDHPEIALRRGGVEDQAGMLRLSHGSDLSANVEVGGFGSTDIPGMDPGYGVGVTLNMELPLGFSRETRSRSCSGAGSNITERAWI